MLANCFLVFVLFAYVESAKILVVVPMPSISHQVVFRPLIEELVNRNHEVTVITPDPVYTQVQPPSNLKEIDLHNLSYSIWLKWFKETAKIDPNDYLAKLTVAYSLRGKVFEEQLKDKAVQELLKNDTVKFDLLILEACVTPALIFSHIYKAPVIQMSSFGANPANLAAIGMVTHPFLYPMHYRQRLYNLTISEKIHEFYEHILFDRMFENQEDEENRMLKRVFGKSVPLLSELRNNVHMLFLNLHPIWLHNQPAPPNVVHIWGIHKRPEKILSEDLQSYLDSSNNGVIYVSFGTNLKSSSMPAGLLEILLKIFPRLPYNILWKWDIDKVPGKSENVKIYNWVPQVDVLRHKNVKLFITQGGLQSTEEAINAGVPLIGIPLFGDQAYNAEKYEYFKIGIKLDLKSLTAERFENAIKTIFMEYDSYEQKVIQLRTQMQDQQKPPLENAIWWIEYVLRHGGARQLHNPAAKMSWIEYYELKLVFVLLCVFIILVIVTLLISYFCLKFISQNIIFKNNKTKIT